MKKINYSNFNDNTEVIPVSFTEKININQNDSLPIVGEQISENVANAISPSAALASVANRALDTISNISKCIAMVSIEKERTRQIKAQAQIKIEESIQQTKRIKIQESENTKRLIIQCKADLEKKELELKMLCETNLARESELKHNHKLYMIQLNSLNTIVQNIMNDKNIIYKITPSMHGDSQSLETLLHSLNDINNKLVQLSEHIVALQKG